MSSATAPEDPVKSPAKQNNETPLGVVNDPNTIGTVVTNSNFQQAAFLSNTLIPLPPRTIGGIRDQVLKIKRCNCKKSGCLKLYCDCFNSGIFCNDSCCCNNCRNIEFRGPAIGPDGKVITSVPTTTPSKTPTDTVTKKRKRWKDIRDVDPNLDPRIEMIQIVLDRNQHAFRPKAINITASQRGDEARGTVTTSLTSRPLMTGESRAKKTKLGCNCRKSFCLKKYCDCFQSQLYCMSTCRCKDCQNKVGNEKREKLIAKLKKKKGEKESQKLAALGGGGGSGSGVEKDNLLLDASVTTSIGGVPAKTVAMVTAGVTAAGIDVFLPASNYAKRMILKGMNGEEDRTLDEIAFGMVGRQKVGGPTGPCVNDEKPNISTSTVIDVGKDVNKRDVESHNNDLQMKQSSSMEEDMNTRIINSFKAVLARMETGTHIRQENNTTSTSETIPNSDSDVQQIVQPTNDTDHEVKDESKGTARKNPGEVQVQNMERLSCRPSTTTSTCTATKSIDNDFNEKEYAETIIAQVMKDLIFIKKRVEAADIIARKKVDEYILNKKSRHHDSNNNAQDSADVTMGNQEVDGSVASKEDDDNDKSLLDDNLRQSYSRAVQDAAFYRELSLIFRQRALELARLRQGETEQSSSSHKGVEQS